MGILCLITGLAGCFLPVIPGPPVAYTGLLLLHFTDKVQYSATQLLLWLLIVVIVQVLDYFVPVSYTHLDVYKRQEYREPPCLQAKSAIPLTGEAKEPAHLQGECPTGNTV